MIEIWLTSFYAFLFLFIIYKQRFFRLEGIQTTVVMAAFLLKIASGLVLWWIYTYYYPDRTKADIYKYYDDSKPLYDLLFKAPLSFFQILFGIHNEPEKFHYVYDQMYNWYSPFATHIYNANQAIIRINAVIRIFSFGHFNVHTVFFCFLSFIGQIAIYKTFHLYLKTKKWGLFAAVFLLPTVLFWGSGVLKEAILLFGLGLFVYGLHSLLFKKVTIKMFFVLGLGILTMALMKIYILIALLPGVLLWLWIKFSDYRFLLLKYVGILVLILTIGYSLGSLSSNYNAAQMLSFRQKDFYNAMKGGVYFQRFINNSKEYDNIYFPASKLSKFKHVEREDTIQLNFTDTAYIWDVTTYEVVDTIVVGPAHHIKYRLISKDTISGSGIELPSLEPTYVSVVLNSPAAFVTTLTRPHPFEADSLFSVMAAMENLFIEFFVLFCLFFVQKPSSEKQLMALFSFSFVAMLFILTGLVTPVIGAIVRYKMPALPFLIIAFLLLLNDDKLTSFLTKIKFFRAKS